MGAPRRHDWWLKIKMRIRFLIFIWIAFALTACKFNPNLQDKGSDLVQGKWEEIPLAYQDELLQYTRHQFSFSCDSFYVQMNTSAKANTYPDSCFNGGNWEEYAKGTYRKSNDTLYLNGTFTKSNWKQKISGCYRIGQYLEALIIEKRVQDTLYFKSLTRHTPLKLKLLESVVCKPKPLN